MNRRFVWSKPEPEFLITCASVLIFAVAIIAGSVIHP